MSDKFHGGIVEGSTDVSIPVMLRKTTDNTEQTGKIHSDVTASYWRQGGVRTAITTATLGSVNAAHSDGGFIEVDATNMRGEYRLDVPDAAFASGADWVVITAQVAGCYSFVQQYTISKKVEDQVWNAARSSHTTAGQFGEGVASVTGAVGSVTGNVGGNVAGSVASVAAGGISAASFAAGAINASAIATDAIGALELAADAAAEIAAAIWTIPDAATIAAAVWDALRASHTTSGSFGQYVNADLVRVNGDATAASNLAALVAAMVLRTNTAAGGSSSTVTLDASAPAVGQYYRDNFVVIIAGTGAGQVRCITDYSAARVATVFPAWNTAPTAGSTFVIIGHPRSAISVSQTPDVVTAGTIGKALDNLLTLVPITFLRSNACQSATATTLRLDASAASNTNAYKGALLLITNGSGSNQVRRITAYNGTTKDATIDSAWDTTPSGGDSFVILATAGPLSTVVTQDADITLTGAAQAGASTSITLPAGASAVTDFYKYQVVTLTGGTGAGQSRIVTAYNGTTKVATVDSAWATNPDATTTFVLRGMGSIAGATAPTASQVADAVWDEDLSTHDTAGVAGAALNDVVADARNKKLTTASTREVKVYKGDGTTVRYKRTISNPDSDTTVATPS